MSSVQTLSSFVSFCCHLRSSLRRNPSALLPGAAPTQHPLVSDQRDVARRGALPGLFISAAGIGGLPSLHEP